MLEDDRRTRGVEFAFATKSRRGDQWSPAGVQCTPLRCGAFFSLLGRGRRPRRPAKKQSNSVGAIHESPVIETMNLHPLFLLGIEAQKKKLGKKKHAVMQGAALHPLKKLFEKSFFRIFKSFQAKKRGFRLAFCICAFFVPCRITYPYFFFLHAATTIPERVTSASTLGITIRLLNISASSQTRSLDASDPRKMNPSASTE